MAWWYIRWFYGSFQYNFFNRDWMYLPIYDVEKQTRYFLLFLIVLLRISQKLCYFPCSRYFVILASPLRIICLWWTCPFYISYVGLLLMTNFYSSFYVIYWWLICLLFCAVFRAWRVPPRKCPPCGTWIAPPTIMNATVRGPRATDLPSFGSPRPRGRPPTFWAMWLAEAETVTSCRSTISKPVIWNL